MKNQNSVIAEPVRTLDALASLRTTIESASGVVFYLVRKLESGQVRLRPFAVGENNATACTASYSRASGAAIRLARSGAVVELRARYFVGNDAHDTALTRYRSR
jgi:hypothetical protein